MVLPLLCEWASDDSIYMYVMMTFAISVPPVRL